MIFDALTRPLANLSPMIDEVTLYEPNYTEYEYTYDGAQWPQKVKSLAMYIAQPAKSFVNMLVYLGSVQKAFDRLALVLPSSSLHFKEELKTHSGTINLNYNNLLLDLWFLKDRQPDDPNADLEFLLTLPAGLRSLWLWLDGEEELKRAKATIFQYIPNLSNLQELHICMRSKFDVFVIMQSLSLPAKCSLHVHAEPELPHHWQTGFFLRNREIPVHKFVKNRLWGNCTTVPTP